MKKTTSFDVIDETFESSQRAMHSYILGFALSLVLTIIPYVLVTRHMIGGDSGLFVITLFAVGQLLVQVFFFLHLPAKVKPYWDLIVFFYTILILLFLVIGTLWIMYHLNVNMMGVSPFNSNEGYIPQ